jgi:hypothetical protein
MSSKPWTSIPNLCGWSPREDLITSSYHEALRSHTVMKVCYNRHVPCDFCSKVHIWAVCGDVLIKIMPKLKFILKYATRNRSQWPHGLRHELSSLVRTLGSWVRIPLKAWMSVLCAFILCLCCSCVGRGLATGWSPVQGVLPIVYRIKKLKKCPSPNKGP